MTGEKRAYRVGDLPHVNVLCFFVTIQPETDVVDVFPLDLREFYVKKGRKGQEIEKTLTVFFNR
jgi:hypothetical protein